MDTFIKISLLVIFLASTLFVGFYCRRRATNTDGFVLGGRSVGPWLSAFAYGTSYFSAVIFVGYAGQFGWKFGIAALWIGIGNAIIGSLLAWVVLGRRTRLLTQKINSATMPDFFGKRFNSTALKIAASIIVFVFLIPYTASLYNGLSRLFSVAFPGLSYEVCIVIMAIITAIYVIVGGFMATAINDFIQGIIMLVGIVAVVIAILRINDGFSGSIEKLLQIPLDNNEGIKGYFASLFGPDPINLLMIVIFTSLGTWGLPQMIAKFYSIKDERQVRKGTIISTLFALIVAGGCYFLGGFGRLFEAETTASGAIVYDSIIPNMITKLPVFLVAIVIVLVLAASMSTLSSLVLTSSSTLTMDIVKKHMVKKMNDKKQMLIMRIFIVVFIAISAVIAIVQSNSNVTFIAQLMGISWGALAGAFLGPFLYSLYYKKTTKASVWASFISGVLIMVLNLFFGKYFTAVPFLQSPINCGVIAMAVSLLIVPLVSLFTKKPDQELVDDLFSCYETKVLGPAKEFLGDDNK